MRWFAIVAVALMSIAGSSIAHAQDIACDRPGAKEVRSLHFRGNTTFSDDDLSARVVTTASSFMHRYFRWLFNAGAARCLPENGLGDDIELLKTFYRNNGFYRTKVEGNVTPVPPDQVDVTFTIDEGAPLRAESFAITGLDSVPDSAAIVRDLPVGKGQRVGLLPVFVAADTIKARLRNAGYPLADILKAFTTDTAKQTASVELQVVTGARARIGTIAITRGGPSPDRGPEIDSSVVLRLLHFRTGDWYTDRALANARRNLYSLGAFRHVGIELDSAQQINDTLATVLVDVREDYLREYHFDEGWAQLDCFTLQARYSDLNFLDRALRLDLTGRVSKLGFGAPTDWGPLCRRHDLLPDSVASSKLNYYAGATIRQPPLFGSAWIPEYSAYTERRGQYKSYLRTTFVGLNVAATRNIALSTPLRFGYALEYGQTVAEPAFLCAVFTACTPAEQGDIQKRQPFGVASASLQQVRVDNLVEPRSGYTVGGELRGASPFLGSAQSLEFFKVTGDGSLYRPLTARTTVALRIQGGLIGGTTLPPPQERLYAGGAASVRGFQQNLLGPLVYLVSGVAPAPVAVKVPSDTSLRAFVTTDTTQALRTIPTGGNRLVVFNAELRIRDPFIPNLLEYVPFVDAGEVFASETGQPGVNLDRLSVTPGLGLRVFTPIGPIQVNAGYNPAKIRAGQAYWAPIQPNGTAPLICVTTPGAPLAPVKVDAAGNLIQNVSSDCPATFVPKNSSAFFSRFVLTFSIGTGF